MVDYPELEFKRDWPQAARRLSAWWDCEVIDRAVIQVTAPRAGVTPRPVRAPEDLVRRWTDVEYVLAAAQERMRTTYYGGDAFPFYYPNLGPDAFAAYLGCDLEFGESTSWSVPMIVDWDDVPPLRLDPDNRWWRLTLELVSAAMEVAPGRFVVGMHDLHGGLDGVAALRDPQTLCLDLIDHPERVKRVVDALIPLYFEVFDGIWNLIHPTFPGVASWMGTWAVGKSTPIQSDFICMISPRMYEEFAAKHLRAEAAWLDRSVYHLDGPAAVKHLDAILQIPKLNAVQWVPGANSGPMLQWVPLLRRIQAAGKALHLSVLPEEVEPLLRELRPEGLCLQTSCASEAEARDLVRLVERLTPRR